MSAKKVTTKESHIAKAIKDLRKKFKGQKLEHAIMSKVEHVVRQLESLDKDYTTLMKVKTEEIKSKSVEVKGEQVKDEQ